MARPSAIDSTHCVINGEPGESPAPRMVIEGYDLLCDFMDRQTADDVVEAAADFSNREWLLRSIAFTFGAGNGD